jgi:hypothetical protein
MNIIATTLLAGAFAVMPGLSSVQIANIVPASPIESLTISAAGVGVDISGKGVETQSVETTDFVMELNLKSGTPIRIRL